jgi:hypothetical protein
MSYECKRLTIFVIFGVLFTLSLLFLLDKVQTFAHNLELPAMEVVCYDVNVN